jgi:hypothetical protein
MDKSKSHSDAVERFQAAREERDRRAGLYEAASGSPSNAPLGGGCRGCPDEW